MADQAHDSPRNGVRIAVWSGSSKPLGKIYDVDPATGHVVKTQGEALGTRVKIVSIRSVRDYFALMKRDAGGQAYFTSGVPEAAEGETVNVTVKDSVCAGTPGYTTRSHPDVAWRSGVGSYFILDFDADWWPAGTPLPTVEGLRERLLAALAFGGVDGSHVDMIAYTSSSSSLILADGTRIDKGGRHLIFLVKDAGDLPRFIAALKVFLTLSAGMWGAVGNAGHFLQRGVADFAALQPQQPTFSCTPACASDRIRPHRESWAWPGEARALDTAQLRDPTPGEKTQARTFWASEKKRLAPEIADKGRAWLKREHPKLRQWIAETTGRTPSDAAVSRALEERRRGHLIATDMIELRGRGAVAISDILCDPRAFDGAVGPDPIEPDYHGGASVARVYANPEDRVPRIFSQAHGGIRYSLWYTPDSALQRLAAEDGADSLREVMHHTKARHLPELEAFLKKTAKLLGTPKSALQSDYGRVLRANMNAANPLEQAEAESEESESETYEDIPYAAAKMIAADLLRVECLADQLWQYDGRRWRPMHDHEVQQRALPYLQELNRAAQERNAGAAPGTKELVPDLTTGAIKACQSLKQQSYRSDAAIGRPPAPCINFLNGELWLLRDGIGLRPHDPESGQTFVNEADYDAEAQAPLFESTMLELCMTNEQHLRVRRECEAISPKQPIDTWTACQRGLALTAEEWREIVALKTYLEEVLAYWIVPRRQIAAFWLFIGNGHNGKSFLTQVAQMLLPPEAVEVDRIQSFEKDNHGMARLIGKVLLVDDDMDTGIKLPEGFLKKISEERLLSANPKNRDDVSFVNRCVAVLLSNNPPSLADLSRGTRRRLHVVDLPRNFYQPRDLGALPASEHIEAERWLMADKGRLAALRNEVPGILNVLATTYVRLLQREDFLPPPSVSAATDQLIAQANPLPQFIGTCCRTTFTDDDRARKLPLRIPTAIFHASFEYWCSEQHYGHYQPTPQKVRAQMEQLGFRVIKGSDGIECYEGIRVNDPHRYQKDRDTDTARTRYLKAPDRV